MPQLVTPQEFVHLLSPLGTSDSDSHSCSLFLWIAADPVIDVLLPYLCLQHRNEIKT